MKRQVARRVVRPLAPLVAGLALVAASACTDASGSVVIMQAQVPAVTEQGCEIPAGRTMVRRDRGVLDVALDHDYPYYLYPLVASRLPPIAEEGDVEPNRVTINAAQVRLEAPPGVAPPWTAACPAEYDEPTQLELGPGDEGSIVVRAMRDCHASVFRALFKSGRLSASPGEHINVRATVRAKGRHGSTRLLSDPFEFPIRVCYGCLQMGFGGAYSIFDFPQTPSCDKLSDNPFRGNPCNIAQDFGPVLCCATDAQGQSIKCPGDPRGTGAGRPAMP